MMAFNHYAKISRILATYPDNWYVVRIDEPTQAKNFKGESVEFDHFYRVYDSDNQPIKYCKFQQLDRFAQSLSIPIDEIPIIEP